MTRERMEHVLYVHACANLLLFSSFLKTLTRSACDAATELTKENFAKRTAAQLPTLVEHGLRLALGSLCCTLVNWMVCLAPELACPCGICPR